MSVRGELKTMIAGKDVTLRLTLGAVMEIEESLGVSSINDVFPLLQKGNAKTILTLIVAMSKAGGTPIEKAEAEALDFVGLIAPLARALTSSIGDDEGDADAETGSSEKKA